jgi:phosphoribosyl 1,2-cyclic phosphodiesterase
LQERILGNRGHLCNEAAAQFALRLAKKGTRRFVLSHLSRDNNTPELARTAVCAALEGEGVTSQVCVAPRDELSPSFVL